jgi:hypothetical protein
MARTVLADRRPLEVLVEQPIKALRKGLRDRLRLLSKLKSERRESPAVPKRLPEQWLSVKVDRCPSEIDGRKGRQEIF